LSEPALVVEERPASGGAEGLLVLHHGRGTDERDLLGLADLLDPERRLRVVSPRAPLELPGSPGHHWYVVRRVGFPDAETFEASYTMLSALHDELWRSGDVPAERTILGGFSMGAVMSYATGLGPGRPRPAGVMALSGFVPTVEGWQPDLAARAQLPVLIAHGALDPVIEVEFARRARSLLEPAGLDVEYLEFPGGHHVDSSEAAAARAWIERALAL
jgi:phospholipase/carboxylesterase